MAEDLPIPDEDAVREQKLQYGSGDSNSETALDSKYPNRPRNLHKTLPFSTLLTDLFNPLLENSQKHRPTAVRRRQGPQGQSSLSPHEARRNIIERYISKWRKEVGDDFYPAMRLIIPEKDRDRPMYGLKEKAIAKVLIEVLKINKDSEDAKSMINWKLPGQLGKATSSTAGDFAGRCFEVLSKRQMRSTPGEMTIAEVNNALDHLAQLGSEKEQSKVFKVFYRRMNAEEMTWLIRMILRQMKIGATEKTILDIWHPDAETLFNVSSNLRRVCWELFDPDLRLDGEDTGIALMECFQPQLAAFQKQVGSFDKMVKKLTPTPDDDTFWIEEKLDGERMQLHMVDDPSVPGGKKFGFWSRKAKDYAYLYGSSLGQTDNAFARFLGDAFAPNVKNIILDGEMITWDMDLDHIVGFGTLKTAAISEKENRNGTDTGQRPLYRVFDCLYLNDTVLTQYTLRDRRNALKSAVKGVRRRLEIHPYIEAHSYTEIEPELRKVVAEASEGLVLKNPRSMYRLNERNDDWIKVKPEYMSEFGESLDCVVIGGYFGSGHRGGAHSSFLCGLLVNKNAKEGDADYEKCYSFFKVGGGFSREDYASVRGRTEGKWHTWDAKRPPSIIELGGHAENRQHERPDEWIRPSESVVLECKAATVESSDKFRMGITLRFPRFKQLRNDKGWKDALSISEFMELKDNVEREVGEKEREFKIEQSRRKKARTSKKALVVAGNDTIVTPYAGPQSKIFDGLCFFVMTDALTPEKKPKAEIEALVKAHGGKLVQRETKDPNLVVVAEKRLVKVLSLEKRESNNIVKPIWIWDCIRQSEADVGAIPFMLPFEPNRHMFFLLPDDQLQYETHVDEFGDSYTRDITDIKELREIFEHMPRKFDNDFNQENFLAQTEDHGNSLTNLKTQMFSGMKVFFSSTTTPSTSTINSETNIAFQLAKNYIRFGGGVVAGGLEEGITHVVVEDEREAKGVRRRLFVAPLPRIVGMDWVERCWREGTRVDEERFMWG